MKTKTKAMKRKRNVRSLVHKRAGKDAAKILNKVDKMLKRGVPRKRIESALAKELVATLRKHLQDILYPIDAVFMAH